VLHAESAHPPPGHESASRAPARPAARSGSSAWAASWWSGWPRSLRSVWRPVGGFCRHLRLVPSDPC
jgi:hypothetical protein